VLTGENAWCPATRHVEPTATRFYRANNSNVWGRTADVNTIFFQYDGEQNPRVIGVGFPSGKFSGDQSFFKSARPTLSIPFLFRDVILCDDYVHPSEADLQMMFPDDSQTFRIEFVEIEKETKRPIIYLNTCNHLMHIRNTNPDLETKTYIDSDFEFLSGTYENAEEYAKTQLPDRSEATSRSVLQLLGIRF